MVSTNLLGEQCVTPLCTVFRILVILVNVLDNKREGNTWIQLTLNACLPFWQKRSYQHLNQVIV